MRREEPRRVAYDFGPQLTPTLERMTALDPQERYEDLGTSLEELLAALEGQDIVDGHFEEQSSRRSL